MDEIKFNLKFIGVPLIKFQNAERISRLQQGKLYAKTLDYYRNLEITTGDSQIGDTYEGVFPIFDGEIEILGNGIKLPLKNQKILTKASNYPVFCMCCFKGQERISFNEIQKEKFLNFGDTALIITNSKELEKRVILAAEKKGYKAIFGKVNYYSNDYNETGVIKALCKDINNVAFFKRDTYAYQQEARFLFVTDQNPVDHIELDIGDISDISITIPTNQLLYLVGEKVCVQKEE